MNKAEKAVWQRSFWEHQILDDRDFTTHVRYIHYNPVHHNLAASAIDWPYSSFHRYVNEGKYSALWGMRREMSFDDRCYGE
jgi:putative transposase